MFLPATPEEMKKLGWAKADIILVSGDAYIDSPFSGTAVIGKSLTAKGFKVAVISQPDIESAEDIMRLGSPSLYWGISAGATDSLVANYTASGKKRRSCDFTPGGENNKRPDRASIVYTNLIKRFDHDKKSIVLGGIEASLRRMSHYDMLSDKIRRPLLFDAKADWLIYGMGEFTAVMLAESLQKGGTCLNIPGLCYISNDLPDNAVVLPPYEEVERDKDAFHTYFKEFYAHASTLSEAVVAQKCGRRWLIQNPPYKASQAELDHVYGLDYEREAHPHEIKKGGIKAVETIRFSVNTHRGCFGECNFCAIAVHQGRVVVSRSEKSIINEIERISKHPKFRGIISDVGGATANMYGAACKLMEKGEACKNRRCLFPSVCPSLKSPQKQYVALLEKLHKLKGIKKLHITSGIRTDLALADKECGRLFIKLLAARHTSGQIKLAPEHTDMKVLQAMGKCGSGSFIKFIDIFMKESEKAGKKQFTTCYFMAAHPGSTENSMHEVKKFSDRLKYTPEQVQIFTPTPSTWSTCMYHTGKDVDGKTIYIPKSVKEKIRQKEIITKRRTK